MPFFFVRWVSWLLDTKGKVPVVIAEQLKNGLFSSFAIFLGGILNTSVVAATASWRHPTAPFISWLLFEIGLGVVRLSVLAHGKKVLASEGTPPRELAAFLSCLWAFSVGIGTYFCIISADWVLATIACLSAAAMVCGTCLRNFGTPRLAATMVFLTLAPCALAGCLTAEPIMPLISFQLPVFMLTIFSASFALHKLLVSWMTTLVELERSQSLTDTILRSSPDHMLVLEQDYRIAYSNHSGSDLGDVSAVGENWLDGLAGTDRAGAHLALMDAKQGRPANFVLSRFDGSGARRWFDIAFNTTPDDTGRLVVAARDITHQKRSEEQAIWTAQHDALTGLPNRILLQQSLDDILARTDAEMAAAMLILDVDNFKLINDTVGHDGGDALLCAFAERLRRAVHADDLVARTGGDEFALLISAQTNADVERVVARIYDQLRAPLDHGGRLIECGASIGASLMPRDGRGRSEIMKAADIALYAAKTNGRAQLRIFETEMMESFNEHQAMLASARFALHGEGIIPFYQPKISLRTSQVVGFEALLRWTDRDGRVRTPDGLHAAFDDPALSAPISDMMLDKVLDDVARWHQSELAFGHVAINVTGADFRRGRFAERVISSLTDRNLPPWAIQIEVTENVFLGHGTQDVDRALKALSDHGIRIALDDFGTGYASLSHLTQFPVDILKIDRSFIEKIGHDADAEAIISTVVNLGHCLGLEVVAEGIETKVQQAFLQQIGCDTAQGFLYSTAVPAQVVPERVNLFGLEESLVVAR